MPETVTWPANTGLPPSGVYSTAHGSICPRRALRPNTVTSWAKLMLGSGELGGLLESQGRNQDGESCRMRAHSASSLRRSGRRVTGGCSRRTGQDGPAIDGV